MHGKFIGAAGFALALALSSAQALAAQLYGTILNAASRDGPATPSTLVELDPATGGVLQTIGSVGYIVNGMTWDATTGTMYGTTSTRDANFPNGLITINLATGAGTPVGSGAGTNINVVTANSSGELYAWSEDTDDAVRVNKVAGTMTVLGDSTLSTETQSLAFDNNDVLWLLNEGGDLYVINTTNGSAGSQGSVPGLPNNLAHHGDFNPDNNLLYAIDREGSGNPRNIIVINVNAQSVVDSLPTANNLHTLAFISGAAPVVRAADVPTLGEWGVIMLSVLLLAAAALRSVRARVS